MMANLILLLERRSSEIDATFVKSQIGNSTTVVSAMVPSYSPEIGLDREEWSGAHHQHGVDLARTENDLKLRDIVLVTIPKPITSYLGLLHVWTSPESTYDIDAVRIPWEQVKKDLVDLGEERGGLGAQQALKWKPDSRNNPHGKNPTNFWSFSQLPSNVSRPITKYWFGVGETAESSVIITLSSGIELEAFERLLNAHSSEGASVQIWADDDDFQILCEMIEMKGRVVSRIPEGNSDVYEPIDNEIEDLPYDEAEKREAIKWEDGHGLSVSAIFQDCRQGISQHEGAPISHVVTSPPYNIRYDPFNTTTIKVEAGIVSRSTTAKLNTEPGVEFSTFELAEGVEASPVTKERPSLGAQTPDRSQYNDDLSPGQYNFLLKSCFEEIDKKAGADAFDLFLNIKSNYEGGSCTLPFYMLDLMPERWRLLDVLIWRYDISFDPGRGKYKPLYEWIIRVGFGNVDLPKISMMDWYIPILKGNDKERKNLKHPAIFPRKLVRMCLNESNRSASLVLDPFLGSGTTLAACLEAGVDGLGFELSEDFSHDILLRIETADRLGNGVLRRA